MPHVLVVGRNDAFAFAEHGSFGNGWRSDYGIGWAGRGCRGGCRDERPKHRACIILRRKGAYRVQNVTERSVFVSKSSAGRVIWAWSAAGVAFHQLPAS